MALQEKYQELIKSAQSNGTANLQVREQDNVLYVDGQVPTEAVKQNLWDLYNKIDPDYRAGDLVMNLTVTGGESTEYEVVKGDSLSKIGQKFGIAWKEIYEANRNIISNPDLIQPGWKLKIPQKTS
ncbi:MAG: LysM peptidoglycan-binding domain-containing protein [Chitinophagaceae bacterium]|nr:LysM peptidoglycan-binding domain-containing protein [Chitinophagaceae bacterium]